MTGHKILETIHVCPKCGNKEGLIVIPGQGVKFYYCPMCYEQKKQIVDQKINQSSHENR